MAITQLIQVARTPVEKKELKESKGRSLGQLAGMVIGGVVGGVAGSSLGPGGTAAGVVKGSKWGAAAGAIGGAMAGSQLLGEVGTRIDPDKVKRTTDMIGSSAGAIQMPVSDSRQQLQRSIEALRTQSPEMQEAYATPLMSALLQDIAQSRGRR